METHSKYLDQIRIKKKKTKTPPEELGCQWDDCKNPGIYRAPVGRMAEGKYFRFCLEHVRRYNREFNYFSGLGDSEIARFQKEAITGHRPTWKLPEGESTPTRPSHNKAPGYRGAYSPAREALAKSGGYQMVRTFRPLELAAFETLGLDKNADPESIRQRYTELVKRHHPDSNGGDRKSEDRFAAVLNAYRILKKANIC